MRQQEFRSARIQTSAVCVSALCETPADMGPPTHRPNTELLCHNVHGLVTAQEQLHEPATLLGRPRHAVALHNEGASNASSCSPDKWYSVWGQRTVGCAGSVPRGPSFLGASFVRTQPPARGVERMGCHGGGRGRQNKHGQASRGEPRITQAGTACTSPARLGNS